MSQVCPLIGWCPLQGPLPGRLLPIALAAYRLGEECTIHVLAGIVVAAYVAVGIRYPVNPVSRVLPYTYPTPPPSDSLQGKQTVYPVLAGGYTDPTPPERDSLHTRCSVDAMSHTTTRGIDALR